MIFLAVEFRDLSRLPSPLTWRDVIFLDEFNAAHEKREARKRLVLEDIRFYIQHSGFLELPAAEAVKLPSYVAALEDELSRRSEEKAKG